MRYALLFAAVLTVCLGFGGAASAQELIGVSGFTTAHGELSGPGTLGGVSGTITSTVTGGDQDCANSCTGTWTMAVGNGNFAGGTFSCSAGSCLYMGRVNAPNSMGFAISTISSNVGDNVAAAIYRHGMWVNDVNAWATVNPAILSSMNMTISDFVGRATADNGNSQ